MTQDASTAVEGSSSWQWIRRISAQVAGPRDDSDVERIRRIGTRYLGCGLITFTVGLLPLIAARAEVTAPWWPPLSVLLVAGPALALIVTSYRPRMTHLGAVAWSSTLGFLAALGLWFLAFNGDTADDGARWSVWLVQFPGIPGLMFALIGSAPMALGYVVVATVAARSANELGLYGQVGVDTYLGCLLNIALMCVFIAIAAVAVRTAQVLDESRTAAMGAAAASAAPIAEQAERARFATLIHDRVIAILLAIDVGRPPPRLSAHARAALEELDHRDDQVACDTLVGVEDASQRLRSAVADLDTDVEVDITVEGADAGYPIAVVAAVVDAIGEAIRNFRRHAGAGSSCVVVGNLGEARMVVAVVDDGRGFEPAQVPPERLGVAGGIRRRMTELSGGSAEIRSEPGRGTTVVLRWDRDDRA
ncbi:ATP-binding protein [Gordonia sp. CPCC 206044]|uniref:sensor histidine kinase n=1 Tax=Gordonia sp. CPCC 206044 TaxID=3140793 RepID=UPI003AF3CCA2